MQREACRTLTPLQDDIVAACIAELGPECSEVGCAPR